MFVIYEFLDDVKYYRMKNGLGLNKKIDENTLCFETLEQAKNTIYAYGIYYEEISTPELFSAHQLKEDK